jgi:pyroglutamyl-peptidase
VSQSRWILTAFEPFAGRASNLSAMVLAEVADERIATRTLPVVFDALAGEVASVLDREPSIWILMGESSARGKVHVETLALNIIDTSGRPDNRGNELDGHPVVPGAPLALPATWAANAVVSALCARGVAAGKSHHAGVYACNQALYLALHQAAERALPATIGFLHVPRRGLWRKRRARRIAAAIPDVFATLARATREPIR